MNRKHPAAVCPMFVGAFLLPATLAALPLIVGEWSAPAFLAGLPLSFLLIFSDLRYGRWNRELLKLGLTVGAAGLIWAVAASAALPVAYVFDELHERWAECRDARHREERRIALDRPRDFDLDRRLDGCRDNLGTSDRR